MKEDMLEVLMYLFENYVVDGLHKFDPSQEELAQELAGAGFQTGEINQAFAWLEELLQICQQARGLSQHSTHTGIRFYTAKEQERLSVDGQALLNRLVNLGVLDQFSREMVIDRVMALASDDIDLDHIRWVILLVLSNQPNFDEIAEWAEVIVTEGSMPLIH